MAVELTPDGIKNLVTEAEAHTSAMRARMETDYDWYRLAWKDSRQDALTTGYERYISSEPRAYAKRMIAWLTGAALQVRVPIGVQLQETREKGDANEKFIIGALDEADKLLLARVMPRLRDQWAFSICIRGWYAGRALLVKQPDGATQVDITPFDPLHTFWGLGAGGLAWVVHRSHRTHDELVAEYPVAERLLGTNHSDTSIEVYDYYDREVNAIAIEQGWLKRPEAHFSPRFPVVLGPVGATPPVVGLGESTAEDTWENYGESVYDDSRLVYDEFNKSMSDRMTLARRAVKPPSVLESRDGKKSLAKDPFEEGSEIDLAQGEKFYPVGFPVQVTPTTDPFLGMVSGDIQRATLPHTIYGSLQFQLSGIALSTLEHGVSAVILPRLQAMQNAYQQVAAILLEQYSAGGFTPLMVQGRKATREYFRTEVMPTAIDPTLVPEITLTADLPQDDMKRYAIAQIAREGKPIPLLPDRMVRDDILKVQDVDGVERMIREQMAEQASPIALLSGFIQDAVKRGRVDLAIIYSDELKNLLQQRAMQQAAQGGGLAAPGGGQPGQVPAAGAPTLRPELGGNPLMGVPPPEPVPQYGPNMPPGSSRPGARVPVI